LGTPAYDDGLSVFSRTLWFATLSTVTSPLGSGLGRHGTGEIRSWGDPEPGRTDAQETLGSGDPWFGRPEVLVLQKSSPFD